MRDRLHRSGSKKMNHVVRTVGVVITGVIFSFALLITAVVVNVSESNRYDSDNIVVNYVNYLENTADSDSLNLDGR